MTTKTRQLTELRIYWDVQDPNNEGWAFRAWYGEHEESGPIEGINADDIRGAIEDACFQLDVELTPDNFGIDPNVDGGFAIWKEAE